jgi:hypothetical protein
VEIHEFQRRAAHTAESQRLSSGSSDASLHAKVLVFDRAVTWVGSFNLDPRSAELNTELAIIIHDARIGQQAAAMVERDLQPDRAWRLVLEPRKSGGYGLVWYGERDGESQTVVPVTAIVEANGPAAIVYVFDTGAGVARRRQVTVGPIVGERVVVIAGLDPGEQVVTDGAAWLTDGRPVRSVADAG